MSERYSQLLLYLSKIAKQTKLIGGIIDVYEMRKRILNGYESILIRCNPVKGPLVSVVVPTRNEKHRLPILLHSIKNQCYQNIEVIVADYMSTDGATQITKSLGAKVLAIDKPGVGYATYLGVEECKGEIIIRTDADAIFPKDIVQFSVDMLQRKDKLVTHVGHVYYDAGFIENAMAFYCDKYLKAP